MFISLYIILRCCQISHADKIHLIINTPNFVSNFIQPQIEISFNHKSKLSNTKKVHVKF